jgi:hypothetical protein
MVIIELIAKDTYRETTITLNGKPVDSEPPFTFVVYAKDLRALRSFSASVQI